MQPLIRFFLKYYNAFLFIGLEIIAFMLIINTNYYQQSRYISFSSNLSGKVNKAYSDITQYFSLRYSNKILAEENAKLHQQQLYSFLRTDAKTFSVNDTTYRQMYEYEQAKVISNSTHKQNNFIMLDKGRLQGVRPNMGIIGPNGIIGIVKHVSDNFSLVSSVLNSKSKISARLKRTDHVGTIIWKGGDNTHVQMNDIPIHVKLKIGDTITSSGYSLAFPQGLPLGIIDQVETNSSNDFYSLRIRLFCDFNNLSYVYIVKNLMKEELEVLENAVANE
jgi:rod shape-determining protein MreC